MKNHITLNFEGTLCQLSNQEAAAIQGGSFAGDIGYAIGYPIGYFMTKGPQLLAEAASIARLIFKF